MSDEEDFEEQLRQEAIAAQSSSDLQDGRTKVDDDGTVFEWDAEKRAWFPKIDDDFIAKYQMGYGNATASETQPSSTAAGSFDCTDFYNRYGNPPSDVNSQEYRDYYEKYCQYYYQQQGSNSTASDAAVNDETVAKSDSDYSRYSSYEEYAAHYREYYGTEPPGGEQAWNSYSSAASKESTGKEEAKTGTESEEKNSKENDSKKEKKRKPPEKAEWFNVDPNETNNVYVTGLPDDITEEEFKELMNKCGLIAYDHVARRLKFKLYTDTQGNPKGDARCCYMKPESVDLALQIIDGSDHRGHTLHVERATFQLKGEYDPSKKKRKLTNKEKKRIKEKQEKLLDWRPDKPAHERPRFHRVVIVKNAFCASEFDKDPALINSVKKDLNTECAKYGDVRKVVIYDRNQAGVASVMMSQPEEADVVVEAINGRWFGGRQITAETWDGRTKHEIKETEEEIKKRDEQWEKFLTEPDDVTHKTKNS